MSVGVEYTAAGLSGLSLPDAPCEHTDIRARARNLTSAATGQCISARAADSMVLSSKNGIIPTNEIPSSSV